VKLYGVGVGPGDPELLTVKAVKVIQNSPHIFVASSSKNTYSLAYEVAKKYIPPTTPVEFLNFSMTKNLDKSEELLKTNALKVLKVLSKKHKACFLTLGDPTMFSTFGCLARFLKNLNPELEIEIIPGITAAQAAAGKLKIILAKGNQGIAIVSGTAEHLLKKLLQIQDLSLVVYKVYKNRENILKLMEPFKVKGVIKCGFKEEKLIFSVEDLKKEPLNYFTLLIKGGTSIEENS